VRRWGMTCAVPLSTTAAAAFLPLGRREEADRSFRPPVFGPALRQSLCRALLERGPQAANADGRLAKCIAAALDNPGGFFRAELAYLSAEAHHLSASLAESMACAVEYFHIASLLLDDLPMMDDSMERRGRICPHLLFGEGPALLAALALITRAYGLLGHAIASCPPDRQQSGHAFVERCLGVAGIVNGQARDLGFHTAVPSSREARQIALQKTVPLIELALILPALLSGADGVRIRQLRRLSVCWGLSYQAIDDLGDVLLSTQTSGKSTGRDRELGRPNVAWEMGFARSGRYLDRLAAVAQASLDSLLRKNRRLEFLGGFQAALLQRRAALPANG